MHNRLHCKGILYLIATFCLIQIPALYRAVRGTKCVCAIRQSYQNVSRETFCYDPRIVSIHLFQRRGL